MNPRQRLTRGTALGALSVILLAACGGGSTSTTGASNAGSGAGADGKVTLKVNFWGDFGLKDLVTKYEAEHPTVKVQLNAGDYNAQHEALQKSLIAGKGAPDIAAIDADFVVQFRGQSDKFANLLDLGAGEYESKYLAWKWKDTLSADGKNQMGVGTDVGGLAMCYRTDLFKAANLPTDRDQVSALWPTWAQFAEVGKKYTAATGKPFVDAASNVMNPVLRQQKVGYFDSDNKLLMDGGPKAAWDIAARFIADKTSANLVSFTPEWNAAFKSGKFATLACPAWMQAYIKTQDPAGAGKWDIAAVPGGSGNWGGSFWTIPKQSTHSKEAWEFIKWALAPEQQISIFKSVGNLPSQPALYTDPALLDFKNPYFSNAPVGKIFTEAAKKLEPQYSGKKSGPVRVAVEAVLTQVQQGKLTPEAGWEQAKKEAEKAAK
ncbi:MAG: cellobiose transport system substrate-binding protein [Actinomycetota bacterium]|nr:cellobiose transport system substrate-binding protein [Actinomycetota bacterium]